MADAPGTTSLPSDGKGGDAAADPSEGGAATPGGSPADPANPSPVGGSPEPDNGGSAADGSDGGGIELPESTETDEGLPGLGPDGDASAPLVTRPLPGTASARGRMVRGYPRAALPAARRSRISSSSVSSAGDRLQVALVATAPGSPGSVLRFYRIRLGRLGFVEKPVAATGGSRAAGFKRGKDVATVTVTPGRTGTSYTVFGTLHAGS